MDTLSSPPVTVSAPTTTLAGPAPNAVQGRTSLWALVNTVRVLEPRTTRTLCTVLLVTYVAIIAVRARTALPVAIALRGVVVAYALYGVARAERFTHGNLRAYTVGLALLMPSVTVVVTGLAGATLSDVVFTGVTIVSGLAFVILGRDLVVVVFLLVATLALLSWALPPASVDMGTQVGILAASIALGTSLAVVFQIYRGLLWQAELAIGRAYHHAQEASAAKSAFLATMSHELRTPMTGILGTADLLAESPSLGADERRHVETIRESGRALLHVINDVLDFSKVEAGAMSLNLEPADIALEVQGAVTLMAPVARAKGLELRTTVACTPRVQIFDRMRFRQVLLNLLSNGIKFTDAGHVHVTVTTTRVDSRQLTLECVVEDTGPGVPDALRAVVFEPFVQGHSGTGRHHGGTGLGLAICARLVRLMGGDIHVERGPGGGSAFRWTIRTEDAGHEPVREATGPLALPFVPSARVLVVDDQEVNRRVVAAMLQQLGYAQPDVASGGRAALEAVSEKAYDIVLMDMQMPEVDGIEATRQIRAAQGSLPYIVALTANVLESDRERCMEAGMNDYLAKPVTLDTLERTMRRAERAVRAVPGGARARATLRE